ncbi:hypothetical protein ATB97_14095 [Elizabethkingia bruuniana]|uniref:Uncharacterized protein n=1 Tax=Chryseobacterium gleum ATCC 35910 TaxID=525257 RepID=A0ABN0AV90_CHRGE|nr:MULTISPECIES: hypothetical protein [Bacteroidota]MDV3778130.1 hypothetical protein [Elizabethkingia anophelis]AQX83520.1 hypothetical protein AYC65_00080 [Elizabethkingia bruuniana]EFK36971.1 hypothetical protein HMPREF0204_11528 [Chryseobacterium gleum ATCC 35910]KUY21723.1 hypothetical protein ATB97_14095 [Elizabethkingia bruuniana]MDV3841436.1 hypothetical protein [Elizabethkingia anophelis]
MAQKTITEKERKENELSEKKKNTPFMQVDKHSDPISNFITNFKRQFKDTKGLGLGKLFGGKLVEQQKQTTEPESIIGATKTVILSDFKNDEKSQIVQKNNKPALKVDNAIKPQQALQKKNNKPKLGL